MLMLSFVGETRGPADYWTSFLPGVLVFGLGLSFTVVPLTTAVMTAVSDQYTGTASGINNALTRVANVFANAIFGALAVLLFTSALHRQLDGMSLTASARQAALAQAGDLGNAKVPAEFGAADRVVIAGAYRAGFIHVYKRIMQIAAALAFTGALMGLLFVKNRNIEKDG